RRRCCDHRRARDLDISARDITLLAARQLHFAITKGRADQRDECVFAQLVVRSIILLGSVLVKRRGIGRDGEKFSAIRGSWCRWIRIGTPFIEDPWRDGRRE